MEKTGCLEAQHWVSDLGFGVGLNTVCAKKEVVPIRPPPVSVSKL